MNESMRIPSYLSKAGLCSRRKATELIDTGKVFVNGDSVSDYNLRVTPGVDTIRYQGKIVKLPSPVIFLYHKPANMVTTLSDPGGRRCIGDVIKKLPKGVFPVGRLDRDVTGLLILTNDGDYAQNLLHPSFGVKRGYLAQVKGDVTPELLKKLTTKVRLPDGPGKFSKAKTIGKFFADIFLPEEQGCAWLYIECTEGRKHFVKNMCKCAGVPVKKLIRYKFGPYLLDGIEEARYEKTKFSELSKN